MAARLKEIARALCYYLCFSSTPGGPNGICLHLNNGSIKRSQKHGVGTPALPHARLKDGISAS